MGKENSFSDSLRVDSETMAKLDSVSKNYSSKKSSNSKAEISGGRERGDEGPGRQGREPGNKLGNNPRVHAVKNASSKANNGSGSSRMAAVKDTVSPANSNGMASSTTGQLNGEAKSGSTPSVGNAFSGQGQGK